ncbi:adenylate/guanylate cyclase domain-containing protein [Methylobacterium planeticum]|uniref:Adenylate/guanylate cyclase domain-containing protein n=1 Tax=Methylobacterium planeticum TaxID=2615211 RepID=A0A6N6MSC2_9HYPH|nr:adenylate/guanylate cyclase domain-containing protein [Methylobacterium planeticum]KAB1072461.1 adenylate/guanylate cyclase domain-containing protein [Methylobacterium planeticum]
MRYQRLRFCFVAPLLGALAGLLYAFVFAADTLTASALRGAFIGAPILLYERGVLAPRWRNRIRQAATPLFAAATLATYAVMIVVGNAMAGTVLNRVFGHMRSAREAMIMSETGFAYALGVSAVIVFVFRVRDLIGPSVFTNLLIGRYHRPISEERIFLFLDVAGSTRFADRHGDLAAQAYLGQIFNALALPVRRSGGSIDDYIGDMALVTWTLTRGRRDAACLRCVLDFAATIAAEAEAWQARFGQVPEFRAALHCGSVVTAEIGFERHKIAYFGDVVNTTARLEALSKSLGADLLVSADLLACLGPLPDDLVAEDLGTHAIRGRDEPLAVATVRQR